MTSCPRTSGRIARELPGTVRRSRCSSRRDPKTCRLLAAERRSASGGQVPLARDARSRPARSGNRTRTATPGGAEVLAATENHATERRLLPDPPFNAVRVTTSIPCGRKAHPPSCSRPVKTRPKVGRGARFCQCTAEWLKRGRFSFVLARVVGPGSPRTRPDVAKRARGTMPTTRNKRKKVTAGLAGTLLKGHG